MNAEDFNITTALAAAIALKTVLSRRTHRKKYLGEEVLLPSTLGEAVNLPKITAALQGRGINQRQKGLEDFQSLWPTMSEDTRNRVLSMIGWYEVEDLEWDDRRSNKRPKIKD